MFDLLDFIFTILKPSQKDFILNMKSENILTFYFFMCSGVLGTFYQNIQKKGQRSSLIDQKTVMVCSDPCSSL